MTIFYKHLRAKDSAGNIQAKGGITLAIEGMTEDLFFEAVKNIFNRDFSFKLKAGYSTCSSDDPFVKKTGRDLAVSRLREVSVKPVAIIKNEVLFSILETSAVISFALTPKNKVILTQLLIDS